MVITSDQLLSRVVQLLPECARVRYVVFLSDGVLRERSKLGVADLRRFWGAARHSVTKARELVPSSVQLLDVLEVEERGESLIGETSPWLPYGLPQADDVALIAFTSGYSGRCLMRT